MKSGEAFECLLHVWPPYKTKIKTKQKDEHLKSSSILKAITDILKILMAEVALN